MDNPEGKVTYLNKIIQTTGLPTSSNIFLKNYKNLKFGSSLEVKVKKIKNNPKRLQREVKKQSKQVGIGTKSQLVLQKQREEMKLERKKESKQIRELENRRKFELKQAKRKQKHRGK